MARQKFDRKAARQALQQRTEESYETKDKGLTFNDWFQRDANLPKFNPDKGEHLIDIIPYPAGSNDPGVVRGKYPEGTPVYVLDVWVHQRIGSAEHYIVCPRQNYNQPCALCDYRNQLRKEEADEDSIKDLVPKRRVAYNIDDLNNEEKGIQVLEIAHFFMEQKIMAAAKKKGRKGGGGYITFSDPDEGKSVGFERTGKGNNTAFEGHSFEDRDYAIDDDVLEEAYILDEYIQLWDAEDIQAVVDELKSGEDRGEEGSQESGRSRRRSRRDGGDSQDGGGSQRRHRNRDDSEKEEETDIPDPDQSQTSRRRQGGPRRMESPAKKDKEEEQAENEDGQCPVDGGVFGQDTDEFDYCPECPIYDDCLDAKEGNKVKMEVDEEGDDNDKSSDPPEEEETPRRSAGRRRDRSGDSGDGKEEEESGQSSRRTAGRRRRPRED